MWSSDFWGSVFWSTSYWYTPTSGGSGLPFIEPILVIVAEETDRVLVE